MSEKKYVYSFKEGKGVGVPILGGKGSNMSDMVTSGLPVPPGFTLTTEVCKAYHDAGKKYPEELQGQTEDKIKELEEEFGKKLGDANDPLLVSVRSGAAVSMPGMMDTILNLGLNDESVEGLSKKSDNPRFAWDSYRRLIQMFGNVVLEMGGHEFEEILENVKDTKGIEFDTDLTTDDLKEIVKRYREKIKEVKGIDFPQDPKEQLKMAIDAVFNSWDNARAIKYRELNNIRGAIGTAVNIQAMVFGNLGDSSGTGVCFTRNPSTGENKFYGEYLMNAQGEDVVAGIRTPKKVSELKDQNPEIYEELVNICQKLEDHYKDMQDIEFTIQDGQLFILQTRKGKRTGAAAVKIAVDLVAEEKITKKEALLKVDAEQLDQLLHKTLDPVAKTNATVVAQGLPASPGAAVGQVVFNAKDAYEKTQEGLNVILVRTETSPEDIEGMHAAKGILTARGGMTSHAAVVARGMGTCCVAGCSDISVDEVAKTLTIAGSETVVREGEDVTLDGSTGEVYLGKITTKDPEMSSNFEKLMTWADEVRKLKVKANADTPHDAQVARDFGAEGIGLCRTEHMFFEGDRIKAVREMILANDLDGRKNALAKLKPMQKEDFKGLYKVMNDSPVIVRLLDPPLHEFLPKEDKDIAAMASEMGVGEDKIRGKISDLHEFNPMLGFRGCRLGVKYPEISEMQIEAILEAAVESKSDGVKALPWIEVPLVGNIKEFMAIKKLADAVGEKLGLKQGEDYWIGTMIEVPRAAITADEIAPEVDFMSFGTNDLTQMGCGFSRDDAGSFLKDYVLAGIYDKDPFQSIDQAGVGQLMEICVEKARKVNPDIEFGICGEHGGDPESVKFCHRIGLNDVSCSPFRVPIARLAAAQAVLEEEK
jgi:pyruvate, orthophosphate dikinase